jgi:hypothetical protein
MAATALSLWIAAPCWPQAAATGAPEVIPAARAAGQGRLRFWGMDVYDARLWVAPGFRQGDFAAHAFALQLRYLRSFSGAAIAQRSLREMRRMASIAPDQAAAWQDSLARVLPDVREGDRITGVNQPGRGPLFLLNGKALGEVGDARFARLFFGIWLAPQTSEPALRAELLEGTRP